MLSTRSASLLSCEVRWFRRPSSRLGSVGRASVIGRDGRGRLVGLRLEGGVGVALEALVKKGEVGVLGDVVPGDADFCGRGDVSP